MEQIPTMKRHGECPSSVDGATPKLLLMGDQFTRAGVPQVILPVWWDTYDFAVRAEWLNIGIWGNRKAAPKVGGSEFGKALVKVIQDVNNSGKMVAAAKSRAEICQKTVGRQIAAEKVLSIARDLTFV